MHRRHMFTAAGVLGLNSLLATRVLAAAVLAADPPRAVVIGYMAAWNVHDADRAASYFDEEVSYFDASVGTPIEGKVAAKTGVIDNFMSAAPDLIWQMKDDLLIDGDKIAFEWRFSGINSGAWADGTAATNKRFVFDGASVFEIKDGLIARQADYYDALGFYKQLGLM